MEMGAWAHGMCTGRSGTSGASTQMTNVPKQQPTAGGGRPWPVDVLPLRLRAGDALQRPLADVLQVAAQGRQGHLLSGAQRRHGPAKAVGGTSRLPPLSGGGGRESVVWGGRWRRGGGLRLGGCGRSRPVLRLAQSHSSAQSHSLPGLTS